VDHAKDSGSYRVGKSISCYELLSSSSSLISCEWFGLISTSFCLKFSHLCSLWHTGSCKTSETCMGAGPV
jgi:hypothetical protein